jgi:hypothetical protein
VINNFHRFVRLAAFLGTAAGLVAGVFIVGMVLLTPKGIGSGVDVGAVEAVLERLNLEERDWKTMIVGATVHSSLPPEAIWRELTDLDSWSKWCPMTRGETRWMEGFRWVPGAQFQHEVELGFPLGSARTTAFVERVSHARALMWIEQRRGAKVCRIWQIDPIPEGGSRITCVEAASSLSTFATRPFSIGPLQRSFEESVNRLISYTEMKQLNFQPPVAGVP